MKKTVFILLLMAVLTFSLTACDTDKPLEQMGKSVAGETQVDGKLLAVTGNAWCSEWVDTETGVHYFYTYRGGLIARLMPDGTPMAEEVQP